MVVSASELSKAPSSLNNQSQAAWLLEQEAVSGADGGDVPSLMSSRTHFVVVQSLSHVQLFAAPWTVAHQPSLSFNISQRVLKLMSIELVIPSNYFILCHPLFLLPSIFPSIRIISNESALCIRYKVLGASASVLLMNVQGWFALGLTDLISLQSKGISRVFSNTTVQKNQFCRAQLSL